MAFAATILAETSQFVLKEGETTTSVKAMEVEKNTILEALEAFGRQLKSLSDVVKNRDLPTGKNSAKALSD